MQSGSDKRAAGGAGDGVGQEELCLEMEVVGRGVCAQETTDFGHVALS